MRILATVLNYPLIFCEIGIRIISIYVPLILPVAILTEIQELINRGNVVLSTAISAVYDIDKKDKTFVDFDYLPKRWEKKKKILTQNKLE